MLLQKGGEELAKIRDVNNETALDVARSNRMAGVVTLLEKFEKGARVKFASSQISHLGKS
jgi:hypothetical protein